MKQTLLLLSCLFAFNFGHAQWDKIVGRSLPDSLPSEYLITVSALRDQIKANIPAEYQTPRYARMMHGFADQQAYFASGRISSGALYTNWPEMEGYVNDVMDKVMPEALRNHEGIHAYVMRDGNYNAAMTPSGAMYINIGLFARIEDEATLAAVLAHELAHFERKHSIHAFFKDETSLWGATTRIGEKQRVRQSVEAELEADSLAVVWIAQSGYDLNGVVKSIRILERIEDNLVRQDKWKWKLEETTHPLSDDRVAKLSAGMKAQTVEKGKAFLVNEALFYQLKKESETEILKALLAEFQYDDGIEMAFRFHLFEPDDVTYVYYLMEFIRRKCYLNPNKWSEGFLVDRYYKTKAENTGSVKMKLTRSLFEQWDPGIMSLSPSETRQIQGRFYWQEVRFTTYEGAFEFYRRLGEKINCTECLLSQALSLDKAKDRNKALQVYHGTPDAHYKQYAEDLMKKQLQSRIPNEKLLVYDQFIPLIRQGQEFIPLTSRRSDPEQLQLLFDSVAARFSDRKALSLQFLRFNKLNAYLQLNQLQAFAGRPLISYGKPVKLDYLAPEAVELFSQYGVREIEFLNCIYNEYHSKESSVSAWEEAGTRSIEAIFTEPLADGSIQVQVNSARIAHNGVLKVRYTGEDHKIRGKGSGFEGILSEIKIELFDKDRYARDLDIRSQNQ